jgi:BASS family bile acid:Na+ symporter
VDLPTLIISGISLSIFLQVLTVGMRVEPADLKYLLSKPARLARPLFVMMILAPLVAVLVCKTFSLHPAVIVALTTLSVAPVAALFSQNMLPLVAPGRAAYARGLFFASTVLSVLLTPLAVELIQALFGKGEAVHVSPLAVAKVVVGSVLVPLGIGLAIGRWRSTTRRWIPAIQKVSGIVLLVCSLGQIAVAWTFMGPLMREGTLTAIALITLIGLVAGHWLGGPDEDDRTVLAFASMSRHPGVAVAVASLTDQPLAPVAVLLTALLGELVAVPYKRWRKKRRTGSDMRTGSGTPTRHAH